MPQPGGIGGHCVGTAIGGDRGGTGAGGHADGVVDGITGCDRDGAAGVAGQQRAGEIGDGEVVGVGTAAEGEVLAIGKIGRIHREVVAGCGAVDRGGTGAGVDGGDTRLACFAAGTDGGGAGEGHRFQVGDIGELAVGDGAGIGDDKGVSISTTINRVSAGQAGHGDIEGVGTSVALQVHIAARAGGDRVGTSAAQHGFKAGNPARSRRCSGGEVDVDATAIAAVIQRVATAAARQVAGEGIAAGELGRVITAGQIDRFKRSETEPINRALIGTREDEGVAGFRGNQAVGVAATREALEARGDAADACGAASGGGAGVAGDAAEGERNGRAIARIAEAVAGAAAKGHRPANGGAGAADQQAVAARAEIHVAADITTAQGDAVGTRTTGIGTDRRGRTTDRELVGAITNTHRTANGTVVDGDGVITDAGAEGTEGAGANGEREGVVASAQIQVAAQRTTAVDGCRVAAAAQGDALQAGEGDIAEGAAAGAADREAVGSGIGVCNAQGIGARAAIDRDAGGGSGVNREGIRATKSIQADKTREGGGSSASAHRGARTRARQRDGLIGSVEIEGVSPGSTGQICDTTAVDDRGGVGICTEVNTAAEGP